MARPRASGPQAHRNCVGVVLSDSKSPRAGSRRRLCRRCGLQRTHRFCGSRLVVHGAKVREREARKRRSYNAKVHARPMINDHRLVRGGFAAWSRRRASPSRFSRSRRASARLRSISRISACVAGDSFSPRSSARRLTSSRNATSAYTSGTSASARASWSSF